MLVLVSGLAAQTMRTAIAFSLMVPLLSACGSASQAPSDNAAGLERLERSAPIQRLGAIEPTGRDLDRHVAPPRGAHDPGIRRRQREQDHANLRRHDHVRATAVDSGRWTLAGQATIIGTFSSDWVSRQTSSLGPCNVHYTDDAQAKGAGVIEGGLEIDDDFFQLTVRVPGVDGTMNSVRDDTGCFGSRPPTPIPGRRPRRRWARAVSLPIPMSSPSPGKSLTKTTSSPPPGI